jgi:hypothetical protein
LNNKWKAEVLLQIAPATDRRAAQCSRAPAVRFYLFFEKPLDAFRVVR